MIRDLHNAHRKWLVRSVAVVAGLVSPFLFAYHIAVEYGPELVAEYRRLWRVLKTGVLE